MISKVFNSKNLSNHIRHLSGGLIIWYQALLLFIIHIFERVMFIRFIIYKNSSQAMIKIELKISQNKL